MSNKKLTIRNVKLRISKGCKTENSNFIIDKQTTCTLEVKFTNMHFGIQNFPHKS